MISPISWIFRKAIIQSFTVINIFLYSVYRILPKIKTVNQPEIFRSFVLMMDLGFTSIDRWQKYLQNDFIFATLIGCSLDSLLSLGSYYDFINRLWLRNPEFEKNGLNDLFSSSKNKKPSQKLGKGKKRFSFFTMVAGINIHLDAQIKYKQNLVI